ncbi:hypothetical protein LV779_04710 [Streptomyces thinghirensis]|nr:hypothetical protein [Streptomyces thinghirensis]
MLCLNAARHPAEDHGRRPVDVPGGGRRERRQLRQAAGPRGPLGPQHLDPTATPTQMWERAFPGSYGSTWSTAIRATTSTARRPPTTSPASGASWASRRGRRPSLYRAHAPGLLSGFGAGGLDLEAFCEAAGEDVVVLLRALLLRPGRQAGQRPDHRPDLAPLLRGR